jgi:hypothetical protein
VVVTPKIGIVNPVVALRAGEPESVTFTLKTNDPGVVGVPVMAPVAAFNDRPAGSEPEVMVHT